MRDGLEERPFAWPGSLLSLGALGILVTSVCYGLAPPATVLPGPLNLAAAIAGAQSGKGIMQLAGSVGVVGDVLLAAGAMGLALELARRGRTRGALGWILVALSAGIFTAVDAMVGFVLPQAASLASGEVFEIAKRVFDVLFLLGMTAAGAGTLLAFGTSSPELGRTTRVGYVLGTLTLLAVAACVLGLPAGQAVGMSVIVSVLLYGWAGVRLASVLQR
jgi:hypothetical protein